MSNIDKHAVQAVADLKAGYRLGHADVAILNELARIALASLEAEAVCVIDQSNLDYLKSGSDADVWPASRAEMGDVLLYRSATPAPVSVPDEVNVLLNHLEDVLPDDAFNLIDVKTWNNVSMLSRPDVYRAAMLQGADGNSPVIPDGYCIMPLKLTADNGAKGALCGEFHVQYRSVCQSYVGEGCEDCNHTGGWDAEIPVSWDNIKRIHEAVVEACALPAAPQQETK